MDPWEILETLFYDDDLTRHLKRTRNAGAKVVLPATKAKRAERVGAALSAAGDALAFAGERAAEQRRARRRARLRMFVLLSGGSAAVAIAIQRRKAASATSEASRSVAPEPNPAEAAHV